MGQKLRWMQRTSSGEPDGGIARGKRPAIRCGYEGKGRLRLRATGNGTVGGHGRLYSTRQDRWLRKRHATRARAVLLRMNRLAGWRRVVLRCAGCSLLPAAGCGLEMFRLVQGQPDARVDEHGNQDQAEEGAATVHGKGRRIIAASAAQSRRGVKSQVFSDARTT